MIIVENGLAAVIYIDPKGSEIDGLRRVARSFADDVRLVTGIAPEIAESAGQLAATKLGTAIIAGTVGQNDIIDALIAEERLDVSEVQGKRETYAIRLVQLPVSGIREAIVVAGSDKRGTFYGIYHLSRLIGVSPWVWWADVHPEKAETLEIADDRLHFASKQPSIEYRGIFINDEWPSFGSWTNHAFGGFNEDMYEKVFQLILRLRGNYLWPAMWSAVFSEDGKRHPQANAELAHAYGIVMGTSHHEPLFRAGEEWQKIYKRYSDSNEWSFVTNREAITKFWEDGILRNKDYENVITLGMRGERDSELGGGLEENIQLLKDIIVVQKELLRKHGLEHAPQVLTVYKEVEKFWHGTDEVPGLKHWDVLDDVLIMLCEDNFGNMRKLPTAEERDRSAGWGMYYHFDYHGGPRSYEWVNTIPLEKIWEQMSMAYDYGVRKLWVVNTGDLKPMELPISYFLDLAYDFETYGTDGINKTKEYVRQWAEQQFSRLAGTDAIDEIAKILRNYTRLNGWLKPEVTYADSFSTTHNNEAERVLAFCEALVEDAKKLRERMPEECRDAYYQIVYYPAVASANVKMMQIYAGLNKKYAGFSTPSVLANEYGTLVGQAIELDRKLENDYNQTLSGGKWRGMMSSAHIGYKNWNAEGWEYPKVRFIEPKKGAVMIVDPEEAVDGALEGSVPLPAFTNLGKEVRRVTISSGGSEAFDFRATASADWIRIDRQEGRVEKSVNLSVEADWNRLDGSARGEIRIEGAGQTVTVTVEADAIDVSGLPAMTFVETHGVIAIEAEHTANRAASGGVEWKTIDDYGKTLSSVKMFPTTVSFRHPDEAPYLEYRVFVREDGDYALTAYTAPGNNLSDTNRLKYGVSFDGGPAVVRSSLAEDFEGGNLYAGPWSIGVLENIHLSTTTHELKAGLHTLRFYGIDAGLVLQRLVLSRNPLPPSFFGPEESYYVGKP